MACFFSFIWFWFHNSNRCLLHKILVLIPTAHYFIACIEGFIIPFFGNFFFFSVGARTHFRANRFCSSELWIHFWSPSFPPLNLTTQHPLMPCYTHTLSLVLLYVFLDLIAIVRAFDSLGIDRTLEKMAKKISNTRYSPKIFSMEGNATQNYHGNYSCLWVK